MTEAPEEVSIKPVDLGQTPVDKKGAEELPLKTTGTGPVEAAKQETVQQYSQNGSEHGEQKPDVSSKDVKDIADSSPEEDSGTGKVVRSEDSSTENEFLESLGEPANPKSGTVDTHVSEPAHSEGLSSNLGNKNEDDESRDEQLSRAVEGYEESNERTPLEMDGLISGELINAPEGAEDEMSPEVISKNKVSDNEAGTLSAVEQETTPGEIDSNNVNDPGAEVLDKEIATESLGSDPTASVEPSPFEVPESQEADKKVSETGSQDGTDKVGVEETSTVEGTNPLSADGNSEETRHEHSSAESVLDDKDMVEAESGRDVAPSESSVPEVKNQADSEPTESVGFVQSVGAGVVSLTSAVFTSAKELIGLEKPKESKSLVSEEGPKESPVSLEKNEEVEGSAVSAGRSEAAPVDTTEAEDKSVSITEGEELPSKAEPLGTEERSLQEAGAQVPEESSVETANDSEDPVPEGELKETSKVLKLDENEEATASYVAPVKTAPADMTESEEKIESKPDDEELLIKAEPISVQEGSIPETGDEVPEESYVGKTSQDAVSVEKPNQSPGVVESVGDGAEGLVGLGNLRTSEDSVSEGSPNQTSRVLEPDEKVEGVAPIEGSSDTAPADITEAAEDKPDVEESSTKAEPVGIQERSLSEAVDQVPQESSLEKLQDPEDSVSVAEPEHSREALKAADEKDTAQTIPGTIRQEDESDNPSIVNAEKESTAVPATTPSTINDLPEDHLSTSAPKASAEEGEEKETEHAGHGLPEVPPDDTVQVNESEKPTFVVAEKALPLLYKLPTPPTTANNEIPTSLPEASVGKDEVKESDNVGTEVSAPPGSSQIGELSSNTVIDEPLAEAASRLKALPSQEQSSSVLQNVNGATDVSTSEQSDVADGVKERSFNVVVPEGVLSSSAPTTPSAPATPSTPTSPGGTPLIKRVEQLEKKLAQFVDKQNSPKSQKSSTGPSTPRSSNDRPSRLARHTLEETLSKGSLLDRVAALERRLTHLLSLPGDVHGQDVSSGAAVSPVVKAEAPAESVPDLTDVAQEDDVKAPLKPLKLDFEAKATPVSHSEMESKAAEEPMEPKGTVNSSAMENLARPNAAEDSAKVSEDPAMLKVSEGSRSVNFGQYTKPTTTTAEVKTAPEVPLKEAVPPQEQSAASTKNSQSKSRKSEGPVSKLRARFTGCFARGGKKGD